MSLLIEAFDLLPKARLMDDPLLLTAGAENALRDFHSLAQTRYTEGTLLRMLSSSEDVKARRAAVLALGMVGTMAANPGVALALSNDADGQVQQLASEALWEIWFRGESEEQAQELRLILSQADSGQQIAALDELLREYPTFAEAINQRAILQFRRGQFNKSIADCEQVLQLNPFHFGAASGMGYGFLRINKPRSALRAFQHALTLNPTLSDLRESVRTLTETLGDE